MNTIIFRGLYFQIDNEDEFNVSISITQSTDPFSDKLWECNLQGLWKDEFTRATSELQNVWQMHAKGDYFQQSLHRHDRDQHLHISYTAIFHEMVRGNRAELSFIKNIYSTSMLPWLSMGYQISTDAKRFWDKQVTHRVATYIVNEQRYKAII